LGLDTPSNLDDLVNVLEKFVENDPDGKGTVGMTLINWREFVHYIYAPITGNNVWTVKDGKFVSAFVQDEQKDAFKFANYLYKNKLLDNEIFVQKNPDAQAKFSSGRAGVIISPVFFYLNMSKSLKEFKPDAKVSILPVDLAGPKGTVKYAGNQFFMAMSVSKSTKDPERVFDFLEFMMSDEGSDLFINGIEGIHYEKTSDGKIIRNEEHKAVMAKEKWGLEGLAQCHGLRRIVNVKTVATQEVFGDSYDMVKKFFEDVERTNDTYPKNYLDRYGFEAEKEIGSQLNDLLDKYQVDFVTGAIDVDANWDKFINDYRSAGYDLIEKEANEKYTP